MGIKVLKCGLLTTVQDKGRFGYEKYGVVVSGAMDQYAMRMSNIIVGNDENKAVLEITLMGPELKIEKGSLISITGGNLSPEINEEKVPMNRPVYLKEDCILKFGRCISGCRTYLAIAGGFDVPVVMESRSTYLRGNFGGKDGRALRKGDEIKSGEKSDISINIIKRIIQYSNGEIFSYPKWYAETFIYNNTDSNIIRVVEDRQFNKVDDKSLRDFFNSEFIIDSRSDRMGYRLRGDVIKFKEKIEMISSEVSLGTIQIPPDGNPIILLADRATAGGYPKIAHVIFCDIKKIVQLKPGEKIKFKKVSFKEAEKLYLKREYEIQNIKRAIELISYIYIN